MSISIKSIFQLLSGIGALPLGISARECYTNELNANGKHSLWLYEASQLRRFEGCTTIIGDMWISEQFAGSIVLNGVTHFNGTLGAGHDYNVYTVLDSIEMSDAIYIKRISLHQSRMVSELSLPRAEEMGGLDLYQPDDGTYDLRGLKRIGSVYVRGGERNVSFPSLEEITSDVMLEESSSVGSERGPRVMHFPALKYAESMYLTGQIASVYTPELQMIGAMYVRACNTTLPAVDLPCLSDSGRWWRSTPAHINLSGPINRINLGRLQRIDGNIVVNAEVPVRIESSIKWAKRLQLSGELEALNFSQFRSAGALAISSNIRANCSSNLIHVYRNYWPSREATFCNEESLQYADDHMLVTQTPSPGPSPNPTTSPYPSWTPTPTPTPTPLTVWGERGLSFGAWIGAFITLSWVAIFVIAAFLMLRRVILGRKELLKAVFAWGEDVKDPTPPPYSDDGLPPYMDDVKG
ncbi:hypothetical protein ASPCAL13704 [Aspergillus calidoustus]|uniref:Uncharacterized protein n=1 Tax=Aspergillus calidoustus TaxID=454130 RepID=A0A0U5GFC2_ASPCI|nr:hypothetical protein ASPCAL13704 [Aspergillus calidoustus]